MLKKDNLVEQEVIYCVKGTVSVDEGYEIDIGPVKICFLKKEHIPNHEMEEPYLGFALYNMFFH